MKPVLQTGTHIDPVTAGVIQFPASESAIGGKEVQEVPLVVQLPVVLQLPELHVAAEI